MAITVVAVRNGGSGVVIGQVRIGS